MIRLIQLQNGPQRRVAFIEEPRLVFLDTYHSVYDLARAALHKGTNLADLIEDSLGVVVAEDVPALELGVEGDAGAGPHLAVPVEGELDELGGAVTHH